VERRVVLDAVDESRRTFAFEGCARKEPWTVSEGMFSLNLTSLRRMTECGGADAQAKARRE
jgi:hypothetical protein